MISINQLYGRKLDEKKILFAAKKTFRELGWKKKNIDIAIAVVPDNEIKKLNKFYRKTNKVTDVLSFSYGDKSGEVVISYNQAKKQAKRAGHSLIREVQILLVHGILHIAGFDHNKEKYKKEMIAKEEKILGGGLCLRI